MLLYCAIYVANSGGENISSIEVETVLHQHEAVLHVAVVAMPDPFWGEVPVAVVETKPGVEVMRLAAAFFLIRSRAVLHNRKKAPFPRSTVSGHESL